VHRYDHSECTKSKVGELLQRGNVFLSSKILITVSFFFRYILLPNRPSLVNNEYSQGVWIPIENFTYFTICNGG